MSDKPAFSSAAEMDPVAGIASTNKVLSNTYWLLGLTLYLALSQQRWPSWPIRRSPWHWF